MVRIGCGVTGTFATIGLGVCVLDNIFGVGVVDDAAIPALGSTAFAMFTIAFTGEDPGSSCDVY